MTPRRAPALPAFVLHARPYRESHWLLEVLTPDQGRLTTVARAPRPETFRLLTIRLSGRQELKRLDDWRYTEPVQVRSGRALLLGLYLNELCIRLVPRFQADHSIFGVYASTLLNLPHPEKRLAALRFFERRILEAAGFGIDYRQTMDSGDWIVADRFYRFEPALGFCSRGRERPIPGYCILAMADNDWSAQETLHWARTIHQSRIDYQLEDRVLISRQWI